MSNKPTVAIGITAVKDRVRDAELLAFQLGRGGILDPEIIVWEGEVGYKGMVANERMAFEYMVNANPSDWCLLLHDDCVPADNIEDKLIERLVEAETTHEAEVVSFFSMSGVGKDYLASNQFWYSLPGKKFRFEQALAMRTEVAQRFVEFSWAHGDEYRHTDVLLADFFHGEKLKVHYPLPNLFDHRLDMPSTVGHNSTIWGKPRNSRTFERDTRTND